MALGIATAAITLGQPATQPPPAAPAGLVPAGDGAIAGKESNHGVYVRDSAVAVDKFALAGRMEKLKEWNKAADALQEILEKNADRVVPSQVDAKNVIYQYTSVTTAVQERLAKWPAEGLDVYRARYEPQAAAIIANAPPEDVAALHRAYALYFVTDTGKNAGLRLVDLYLESGEFPAAAWLAERMLAWHPSIDAERPRLLYRAALAQHLAGDAKNAAAKLEKLKQDFADAKGLVRGQEVALAESVAQELGTAPPVARGASGDSWPMLGGSPDRGRIPEAGGRLGALINFIDYARPTRPRPADPTAAAAVLEGTRITPRLRDDGMTLGVIPAVDRGEMFFQDNARIYAVSLESGVVLPGWAATYGDRGGQYVAPGNVQPLPRNQQMTVTVTDSSVLAITGQIDVQLLQQGMVVGSGPERETRLVCLDRATGKERWTATARQLPDSVAQLRTLALSGSPLVVGDNVYVLGRGGKPTQFEDAYVLCYSLKDGSYRWSCYIASGNADPNAMQGMGMVGGGDNVAHLAYASGRLYALTNLGALASIDAYSGTIVWLNIYPRPKPDFMDLRVRWDRSQVPPPQLKPWMQNPVIVKDGKVFILPVDAQHVLVYDAGSGVEVMRIRTSDFDGAKTLLAVVGERMLMCSDNAVFCINWQTYDPKHPDRESNLVWHAPFGRQGYSKPSDVIRGRGFVTTDSVFIPTGWALFRLSLRGGRTEQIYPRDREWDQGEGPGNVLVTRDHVILATAERVNVYTDLAVARAKLDAEVDAAPKDPEPRLRYAEMMFVSNQLEIAADKLDEAMALLKPAGGAAAMRSGPQRDRVFNIALTFAQKLSDPAAGSDEDRKLAVELFDRAGIAADSPAQQVIYRMTRARFSQPAEQVRLYQEILADERLRPVPYTSEEGGGGQSQAAAVAEGRIGTIIKTVGRGPYAPFDEKAGEALTAARTGNDPRALLDVANVYPNARVAPEAMLAAAEAFEAANNHRGATQVLNRILRKYGNAYPAAHIVEAQVRNYLKLPGGVGVAIGKLQPAYDKAVLSRPIELPDGSTLAKAPLKAVREALYVHNARLANEALPEFALPDPINTPREPGQPFKTFLPEKPDSLIPDVDRLVVPLRDFASHDRVVTWTAGKGLAIYAVGKTTPIGSAVAFTDTPKGSAWIDGNVLVWGPTRTILLAGETGAMRWETVVRGLAPLEVAPPGDVVVDSPPTAETDPNAAMMRNRAMIRARGFGGNVQIIGGVPQPAVAPGAPGAPAQAVPGEVIDHVCPAGDRVVLSTTAGRVLAIELAGGKIAWQIRLAEGAIAQLLANDDFAVARFADAAGAHIVALDPYSGQATGPRRLFPASMPDPSRQPVNMALSPEGTLVFTTTTQLCGINLFDSGKELAFQVPPAPDGMPRYAGANQPDQLVVANGRILTIANNGGYLYVHSLDNGKQVQGAGQFPTHARDWAVFLRTIGSRVYVRTHRSVTAYNLDRIEDMWPGQVVATLKPAPVVREVMIGRDYVVLLDQLTGEPQPAAGNPGAAQPAAPAPAPRQGYRLIGFSRAQTSRGLASIESGRFDHHPTITSPAGISEEWQGVNGGFYYRTLDRTVHFLRGARPAAAAAG